jgi:apolipoprotein N-acyltransferase
MAVFRAVENRRSLVRCANTGISGFIDPAGRIVTQTALFTDAVVDRRVPILIERSLYTRIGDVLPLLCLLMLVGWSMPRSALRGFGSRTEKIIDWMKQMAKRMTGKRR